MRPHASDDLTIQTHSPRPCVHTALACTTTHKAPHHARAGARSNAACKSCAAHPTRMYNVLVYPRRVGKSARVCAALARLRRCVVRSAPREGALLWRLERVRSRHGVGVVVRTVRPPHHSTTFSSTRTAKRDTRALVDFGSVWSA